MRVTDANAAKIAGVDLVFDVLGGDIEEAVRALIRTGGTLVSIAGPPEAWPDDGLAVDLVVESDRARLQVRSSGGCVTDDCGRTSATSRPSTTRLPLSTRPSDARGRRSSAFVRERPASLVARGRPVLEAVLPLAGASEVFERGLAGRVLGKIVLRVNESEAIFGGIRPAVRSPNIGQLAHSNLAGVNT